MCVCASRVRGVCVACCALALGRSRVYASGAFRKMDELYDDFGNYIGPELVEYVPSRNRGETCATARTVARTRFPSCARTRDLIGRAPLHLMRAAQSESLCAVLHAVLRAVRCTARCAVRFSRATQPAVRFCLRRQTSIFFLVPVAVV